MNPIIYEKTKDGEAFYDIYSRLIKERIVFLYEEIDSDIATTISSTLIFLNSQSKEKPITLYINSPGGTIDDGLLTIYDTMCCIEAPIHTLCIGTAYSAASVILASGTPGYRCAYPNAKVMIHDARTILSGPAHEIKKDTALLLKVNQLMAEILSKHTGMPMDEIERLCKEETFFTAEEALAHGLIDAIVPTKKKIPPIVAAGEPRRIIENKKLSKKVAVESD